MKIRQEDRDAIEELLRKQNQNALFLGIVEVEYDVELAKITAEGNDRVRRGAVLVERADRRDALMQTVRRVREEQKAAGEAALRAAGLDPDKGDFAIDGDEVLQLVGGRWVKYETAQQFMPPEERQ